MKEVYHWQDDSECLQYPAELFFPEKGESNKAAKKICAMCVVRQECLAEALQTNEYFGIRGGLNYKERNKLRKAV